MLKFASAADDTMNSTLTKVSDSIYLFDGNYPGGGNVTSAVFHSGKEAFVFDSLLYPEDTRGLLQSTRHLDLQIKGLVNTHWHIDHVAGNQMFRGTNRIISHSLCADLMRADNPDWLNKELKLKGRRKVRHLYPNEEVEDGSVISVGNHNGIRILHTPGHTPDSIIGWLKEEDVIIAGDTVMEIPFVGYGDSRAQVESLEKIRSLSGKGTKIIQGHGAICRRSKLDDDVRYLDEVKRRTAEYVASGKTTKQASAGINLEGCVSKERYQFLSRRFKSILWCHPENVKRIYSELKRESA